MTDAAISSNNDDDGNDGDDEPHPPIYTSGDGGEAAPRGQIVGGVGRERCVEGLRLRERCGGGRGRGDRRRRIDCSTPLRIYVMYYVKYSICPF